MNSKQLTNLIALCDYLPLDSIQIACERELALQYLREKFRSELPDDYIKENLRSGDLEMRNFFETNEIKMELAILYCIEFLDNALERYPVDFKNLQKLLEKIRDYRKLIQ